MAQHGTYCTQIGPDGSGHERCGAAALASVVLDNGWQSDPWELTVQIADTYGITDQGATSQQLIAAAADYNLDGRLWYRWEELKAALSAGEAVLILCDNQYLEPRTYPAGYQWEAMHWVRAVVASDRDDMVYLYDPLTWAPQKDGTVYQGPVASSFDGINEAVSATPYSEAGVILRSRAGLDLNARISVSSRPIS
jgi:hypothetical protein